MAFLVIGIFVLLAAQPVAAQLPTTNALSFFTNLSAKLVQREFGLSLNHLQIYPTNYYTPAVHRLLQVSANLWEATVDSPDNLPTVFRPRFGVSNNVVFISDYVLVTNVSDLDGLPLLDLTGATDAVALIPPTGDALIFGVPLVIGARTGLPNFNEFSMEPDFELSRKVQLVRPAPGSPITQTNQFFVMSLTVPMGVEFWNSYASNYTRPVRVFATNYISYSITNDLGVSFSMTFICGEQVSTNDWPQFTEQNNHSFLVVMRTNVPALPMVGYLPSGGENGFVNATNVALFDTSQELLMPRWGVAITSRIQAAIVDDTTGRIIDYVLLGGMIARTNLTEIFSTAFAGIGTAFELLWATNSLSDEKLSGRPGILQQIRISRGHYAGIPLSDAAWRGYGNFYPGNVEMAVDRFNQFLVDQFIAGSVVVPFTAIIHLSIPMYWQANDPLVHYLSEELFDSQRSAWPLRRYPFDTDPSSYVEDLGFRNRRYLPWRTDFGALAIDPHAFDLTLKDSLVVRSDSWTFPTNATLSSEILGRIHRGTPWQTLYLKSAAADSATWQQWSGHASEDAAHTHPTNDWALVTFIQTLLNTNSPHDLLSVNEPNSERWSEVLDGRVVLTNISTDLQLQSFQSPTFDALTLQASSAEVAAVLQSIANVRTSRPGQVFRNPGDWMVAPELSSAAPWLNQGSDIQRIRGLTDEAYEKLPRQLLALLREDSVGSIHPGALPAIQFTGYDNYAYAVEVSTNLVDWKRVSTNYPTNGVFEWSAPSATLPCVYYRSVLLP